MNLSRLIRFLPATLLFALFGAGVGCSDSTQARAYARAEAAERQFTVEAAPAIIEEYRRVAALEKGSEWARRAEARIKAVEARVQAEETHKQVFQEHGVD